MSKFNPDSAKPKSAVKLNKMARAIKSNQYSSKLGSSSFSDGDLIVENGGNVVIRDGGSVEIEEGGGVNLKDGGHLRSFDASGNVTTQIGDDGSAVSGIALSSDNVLYFRATKFMSGGEPMTNLFASTDTVFVRGNSATTPLVVSSGGSVEIRSDTDQVYIDHTTTGAGEACVINSAGLIQRVSSSLRYKQNIQPLDIPTEAVLAVEPVTFQDKAADLSVDSEAPTFVGVIAEQLESCGMSQFVSYKDGVPESVYYDRLSIAVLSVVKRQQDQINALESRLSALEAANG